MNVEGREMKHAVVWFLTGQILTLHHENLKSDLIFFLKVSKFYQN